MDEPRYTGKGKVDRRLWNRRRGHVQLRALERFRLNLTHQDIDLMEDGIAAGCSLLLAVNQERRTELHEMTWEGRTVYAVYDAPRGYIRTLLTKAYARSNFRF